MTLVETSFSRRTIIHGAGKRGVRDSAGSRAWSSLKERLPGVARARRVRVVPYRPVHELFMQRDRDDATDGRMRNDVQLATHDPLFNEQVEATLPPRIYVMNQEDRGNGAHSLTAF
jgi:Ribonuclease G/E